MISKQYIYKVSDASGAYIGTWADVVSELTWSQPINTPGTTTVVRLARSAKQTIEQRSPFITSAGDTLTDSTGTPYVTVYDSPNTVGPGSDVDQNYQVDVYVVYGNLVPLVTSAGEPYITSAGDSYIAAVGAPMGSRVFSGTIMDFNSVFDDKEYVEVTIASNGIELSREIVRSGTTTTVTYSGTAHDTIIKSVLDTNPGRTGYSAASIAATGVPITAKFALNTKLDAITSVYNQTDAGWYWYSDVGDNTVYLQPQNTTANHTFILGQHINSIQLKQSSEDIRNTIYFVGGDTGSGILYKKYVDSASVATYGTRIYRITDARFTLVASAQRYATKVLARYSQPIYTTTIKIIAGVYDTETISLGQMVGFSNFGNLVDNILLQIVSIDYSPYVVTLGLGEVLETQQQIVAETSANLQTQQYQSIPTVPT